MLRDCELEASMKWTSETPSAPGVYYWRAGGGCAVKTVILEYVRGTTAFTKELHMTYPKSECTAVPYARFMGGEWAGPIPEPEE